MKNNNISTGISVMKLHQLIVAWIIFIDSPLAIAANLNLPLTKSATTVYQYAAETSAMAGKQGTVPAGGLNWNCIGSRCTISGPWPTPAVASCKALAGVVGPLRSYGHQGAQLDASQLAQCNAGLPAAASKSLAVQSLAPAPASPPPLSKLPPAGLAPTPAAATTAPNTSQHMDRLVTAKDFTPLALPLPAEPQRVTVNPAQPTPPSGTAPASKGGFAASKLTEPTKNPGMTTLPGPKKAMPSSTTLPPATAPSAQGGFAGTLSAPAQPTISNPAAQSLSTINPALARQMILARNQRFTDFKNGVERKKTKAETDAARPRAENQKTRLAVALKAKQVQKSALAAATPVPVQTGTPCEFRREGNAACDAESRGAVCGSENFCTCTTDADGDGLKSIACGGNDCDDNDASRYPGAAEICDRYGHDEDCNESTYGNNDNDGDGHIDMACFNIRGSGVVIGGDDCDDQRANTYEGANEVCDNTDNNCNGGVDEGVTLPRYRDADGDGHGDASQRVNACPSQITENATQAEAGAVPWMVEVGNDCDDTKPDIWRGCQ